MIDFTKIIAGEAGQRETFEELVCQIARRDPPATALEFRRIHGAGGDGGVEAVWILEDGSEHGYQAKFYTVSRNVDWGAIDDSVKTALTTHPKLTAMYIAIACALTGQTQRQTTKGRPQLSGWDQWENHKAKWEAEAKGLGRTITFVPWTAPDLEAKLTEPKMVGLVDYWFGSIELSPAWVAAQCRRTVDALEERYHPEDHVDVSTRAAFDGLLRNQAYCAMLVKARAELLEASKLGGRPSRNKGDNARLDQLAAKIQAFAETTRVLKSPGQNALAYAAWHSICDDLLKLSFDASQAARSEREALKASSSVDGRPVSAEESPTIFNVTEARVEARSARVGADAILYSCYKGLADFGRYILEHRVERFAAAPLTGPRPLTFEETGQSFFDQVVVGHLDVLEAFEELRAAYDTKSVIFQRDPFSVSINKGDVPRIKRAEKAFLALLSPEDAQRFKLEAKEWAKGGSDHRWVIPGKGKGKEVDAHRAKLWVANRAISLGWTKELFGNDRTRDARHEDHGRVERIGKKYQRIALMELMARLADNFWLKPDWGQPARVYDDPLDTEFVRDIEPSIMPSDAEAPSPPELPNIQPLACAALPGDKRKGWVFDADLAPQRLSLALGSDLTDDDWVALYRYASQDIDVDVEHKKSFLDTPWVQSEFYFLALLLLPREDRDRFVAETEANADDFHEWLPRQRVDGPYIGELGRRATWDADPWSTLEVRGPEERSYRVIKPTVDFSWESHLDGSLPDGFGRHIPISWLVAELGLRGDPANLGIYRDAHDVPVIVTSERSGHSVALIRREALMSLAEAQGLSPVWTVIGERMAVEDETKRRPDTRVRYNGLLWLEGIKPELRHWSRPD